MILSAKKPMKLFARSAAEELEGYNGAGLRCSNLLIKAVFINKLGVILREGRK